MIDAQGRDEAVNEEWLRAYIQRLDYSQLYMYTFLVGVVITNLPGGENSVTMNGMEYLERLGNKWLNT